MMEQKRPRKHIVLYGAAFLFAAGAIVAVLALLFNVRERREEAYPYPLKVVEMKDEEIDPAVWGKNFPFEYDTFVRTNKETGAPMLKIQHPEFETWGTGLHARSGVACADCHMPYIRTGSVKVSDHWVRSPLTNIAKACQACHPRPEEELKARVKDIQDKAAGIPEDKLAEAKALIRRGQLRWDFVFSENGSGFHSPQEAARVLAGAIDFARQAELKAALLVPTASR